MGHNLVHPLDDTEKEKLIHFRQTGLQKGYYNGWEILYDHWSLKAGSTTYILAAPQSGKTTFVQEIIMNLAQFEGLKIMIFSPETGSPTEIYAELLWTYFKQPFFKHKGDSLTDEMVEKGIEFVKNHFVVIDNIQQDLDEQLYFNAIREYQEKNGTKVDVAVLDSVSDVELRGDYRDLALGRFLTKMRNLSNYYGVHSILTFHTARSPLVEGKDVNGQKVVYRRPPSNEDFAGGEMPSRKGFFILGLWRPPYNVIDPETGEPFIPNETRVEILKAKPKAIGKRGVVKMYYDAYKNRYYMLDENGERVYAHPRELNLDI